jgi:GLPGLI family protein
MRNIFLLILISFSMTSLAQMPYDYPLTDIEPAELIVTYSLKYQQDSLNPDFIRQSDMLLFLGQNVSKFLSHKLYRVDTIMENISSHAEFDEFLMQRNKPMPYVRYMIYKNYPKDKLTYIEHIPSSTFKFEEDLELFNWQLSGDTSTISGYKVQKAICDFGGRSWVAWFSPEIPYNDGPYKFNGLPGLIFNVHDTRNHYVFEMESIEKPTQKVMIDLKEKNFVETTKQDFFRAKDGFYNNIVSRGKDAGLDSKAIQYAVTSVSDRNNPIELKRK